MTRKTDKQNNSEGAVAEKAKVKKPSLYAVLIMNDDYTTMEFVVHVLQKFFGKGEDEAMRIMLAIHEKGHGVCGIYTREVAETKAARVVQYAQEHSHPLQTRIVPA
ncbi:MAG: ATP-dependent Clp protease adapter ClpS [Proteobacteria bacterium]|nr:MAG: ATP-dependent Clp protease adapter ClpS [Pseudomonadota bacterium]